MSNEEASGENATSPEPVASTEPKALDLQGFVERQVAAKEAQKEQPTPEPEKEPVEEAPEQEVASEENNEAQEPEEAPETEPAEDSELNWDDLSDEEITELASKGKSRLLKRIADLTAKRKLAEQKAAQLEQERQNLIKNEDPLKKRNSDTSNPYKDVKDVAELTEKAQQVDQLIESTEDILFQNEHAGSNDVVYEENGVEYTKQQIRDTLRQAQKARKQHLPAQLQAIQTEQQREAQRIQLREEAAKSLAWAKNKESDTYKNYEALMNGPVVKEILEKAPTAKPFIDMLMMHATNSLFAPKPTEKKASPKPEPPSMHSASAAGTAPEGSVAKKIKAIEARAKTEGMTMDDFKELAVLKDKLSKSKS
jgi:hypothetical protein